MTVERLAVVSVVYEPEVPMLHLQARSLARYLPASVAGSVVVIDNSAHGLGTEARARLVEQYGPHATKVRVVRPREVAEVPVSVGWYSQQVLKLAVARLLDESDYVVLDAKNHLVAPVDRSTFIGPRGLPRVNTYGYRDHPLVESLERTLRYVDLDPEDHLDRFTATITPFVLNVSTVSAMVDGVEARSGRSFGREFVRQRLTEFFLCTAWELSRGFSIDDVYDVPFGPAPLVWPGAAARDPSGAVRASLAQVRDEDAVVFAVHARAFEHLDARAVDLLADLWQERGLLPSVKAATDMVDEVARLRRATKRSQRAKDVPARARAALLRLVRH